MRFRQFFKRNTLLAAVFCGFVGLLCLLSFVLPDKSFSENEKRVLQQSPELSTKKLFEGTFTREYEKYLSDQFAGRNFFVGLNAYYNLMIGRNGVNGVYAGQDGYLIEAPAGSDAQMAQNNADAFVALGKRLGIKPDIMVVPATGYIYDHKLPAAHLVYEDGMLIKAAVSRLDNEARYIDLVEPFYAHRDIEQLYFKTDHHWTSRGARLAYEVYCARKGLEPVSEQRFEIESIEDFYGTTYSRSALWLKEPDVLELFFDIEKPDITVEIPQSGIVSDSMYFYEHISEPDKYPVFLNGNHGYVKIVNQKPSGGTLLLIKDSYAHAMVPFLIHNYDKIIMVDPRYYRQDVAALAEQEGVDSMLVVYGINNLAGDASAQRLITAPRPDTANETPAAP
ncbi:MAG: DHHW family protein [Christensenellales bacterium]|jgi:hypothetical protein